MFEKLKSLFSCGTKQEKLYKFVYQYDNGYINRVQLVAARDPIGAVKKLHAMTDNRVTDIKEFTEIKCDVTDAKEAFKEG